MRRMLIYTILGVIIISFSMPVVKILIEVGFYIFSIVGFLTTLYFGFLLKSKINKILISRKENQQDQNQVQNH
jgi:hypothetical protein